jgi:hypothetical protein
MNFGENESFFERHRYLFQHYYFRFEGLEVEIQIGFENVVKVLLHGFSKLSFENKRNFKYAFHHT